MKRKKTKTKLIKINSILSSLVIVLAIIMFVLAIFYSKKTDQMINNSKNNETSPGINGKLETKNGWSFITHQDYWNNREYFSCSNYNFPGIKFAKPNNWDFVCCIESDNESAHYIFSTKKHDASLPYVKIIDYNLQGCLPIGASSCPLEKQVSMTAQEKYDEIVAGYSGNKILPSERLRKLRTDAFVYNSATADNKLVKGYVVNLGDDVIEFDFGNPQLISQKFINEFLDYIDFDKN